MQISLQEDDGIFHDGVPQIVVLVVKFDDGKVKRIPYPAEKTIAALYQDLAAIAPQVAAAPQAVIDAPGSLEEVHVRAAAAVKEANAPPKPLVDKSRVIEKEDIVTMSMMHERDKGSTCLLVVGMDYRVIEVIGPRVTLPGRNDITQLIQGYDVIDDTAATPERMRVFPDEITLKSKRISEIIPKASQVEEILPCPACQAKNSLVLEGSEFKGKCASCQADITIARVIAKCMTATCKKDDVNVSCFDVGGKYEGICGTCHSKIEVPYAQ